MHLGACKHTHVAVVITNYDSCKIVPYGEQKAPKVSNHPLLSQTAIAVEKGNGSPS